MRWRRWLGILVLAALAAGAAYWFYRTHYGDEAQIRQTVARLAEALSKSEGENAAVSLLKIKTIEESFAAPLSVSLPDYLSGDFSEAEITAHAGRYRTTMKRARVYAHEIEFDERSADTAKIWFSGHFDGESKNGFRWNDVKEIEAVLVRIDRKWKIRSVAIRQVLH